MNLFDFLNALAQSRSAGSGFGRDPRSTRVSFPIQEAPRPPWLGQLAPMMAARSAAQQGLVGGQMPGIQFNGGGGGVPDIPGRVGTWFGPGEAPRHLQSYVDRVLSMRAQQEQGGAQRPPHQATNIAPTGALVGGPLPGIQYNAPPPQTSTRNNRTAPSTPTSTASSRNSNATGGGSGSTYNNLLGQGYQPVSFGGG